MKDHGFFCSEALDSVKGVFTGFFNRRRFFIIGGFFIAFVLAFSGSYPAYATDSIKIAMGYIPNVQFAPYYIALELGYFARENLEVTFDYGLATDIMSLVAKGTVNFGVSDGDQVIIAREKGIPVKVVYTMYVKYPVGIVSLEEKGIKDVRSLSGKKVGTPGPYGSNYIGLQLLLKSAGMDLEDIELSYIGYTQVENILAGKVDAAVVFINNEPVLLRNMGKRVNVIEAYRVTPMVSAAVIAGEKLINDRPDIVRRFVRAIKKASDYAIKNREQVLNIIRSSIPTLNEDNLEINRKVLFASMELWVDEDIKLHGLGYTSREDWTESIELMYSMGLIKRKVTPDECFTNEFLQ